MSVPAHVLKQSVQIDIGESPSTKSNWKVCLAVGLNLNAVN